MTFSCKYIVCGVAVAAVEGLNLHRTDDAFSELSEQTNWFGDLVWVDEEFHLADEHLEHQSNDGTETFKNLFDDVIVDGQVTGSEAQRVTAYFGQRLSPEQVDEKFVASFKQSFDSDFYNFASWIVFCSFNQIVHFHFVHIFHNSCQAGAVILHMDAMKDPILAHAVPDVTKESFKVFARNELFKDSPDARRQLKQDFGWDFPDADGDEPESARRRCSLSCCKRASGVFKLGVANTAKSFCDSSKNVPAVFVSDTYASQIGKLASGYRWQLKSLIKTDAIQGMLI